MELWPAHVAKIKNFGRVPILRLRLPMVGRAFFNSAQPEGCEFVYVNLSIVSTRDKGDNAAKSNLGGRHGDYS